MNPRVLDVSDLAAVRKILQTDRVRSVYVASRVDYGVLSPQVPGQLWGWPGTDITSLLYVGQNMTPVALKPNAVVAFAAALGRRRVSNSITGSADQVLPLWSALANRYGKNYQNVREIRPRQPLLATSTPPIWEADSRVHPITMKDFESYLDASLAMFATEIDIAVSGDMRMRFQNHYQQLVKARRAYGIVEAGKVIFKADVGTLANGVAQIQGVWVDERYRNQGVGTAAMAAVIEYVLAENNTASLYVNEFNTAAIRCYERVGFSSVGEQATVFY